MKFGILSILLCLLVGCGGGGEGGSSSAANTDFAYSTDHPCISNNDTMPGLNMRVPKDNTHGCALVSNPVLDGAYSLKFTVNPGDCFHTDCATDRSRYEIHDDQFNSMNNQTVRYVTNIYIPTQNQLRPRGNNTLFLTQINLKNNNGYYHTLAYLEVDQANRLVARTHSGFTWTIANKRLLTANIFDRWINIVYEIKAGTTDGYIKIWADNTLLVHESRPTTQTVNDYFSLKLGIYNSFRSQALDPYATQIVYFDGINRSIN